MFRRASVAAVLVSCAAALLAGPAAARVEQFTIQPQPLPYKVGTYPLVSGHYTVLALRQPYNTYVVFDDQTGSHTTLVPPAGQDCTLWANAFATPWMLFSCVSAPYDRLYNVTTGRWRPLACGAPCEDIGLAAPGGIGSHWLYMDENAYCDPRYGPCDTPDAYVALPSGRLGHYTPGPHALLDLNAPSLSQPICAPWSAPPEGESLSIDSGLIVLQVAGGIGVAHCGSSSLLPLVIGPHSGLTATSQLIAACSTSYSPYGFVLSESPLQGMFLPGLQPFRLSLGGGFNPCHASFDDNALYLWSETGQVVRAVLPTGPLPTYPTCPSTSQRPVRSTDPNAYQQLVPDGSDQILVCQYTRQGRLASHHLIKTAARIADLTTRLDALRPARRGSRCGVAPRTQLIAFFRYTTADDVPVTITDTPCRSVTNDHERRPLSARTAAALVGRLAAGRLA